MQFIIDKHHPSLLKLYSLSEERCPSLAEGARLEIVYTGNRIRGSNPLLSVMTAGPIGLAVFCFHYKWRNLR